MLRSFRDLEDVEQSEELSWIESQFKGLIIGKKGKGLLDLERKTGAEVYKEGTCIIVHGTKSQREDVKDTIRRKIVCTVEPGFHKIVAKIMKSCNSKGFYPVNA